jgi:UDP-N-acetyl-D-glucosamine dehydrogenase
MTRSPPDRPLVLAVVGLGNAGLALAVAAAPQTEFTWGLDVRLDRVERVNTGISPVDTVRDDELRAARPHFRATTNPNSLASSWVIVICVPTPFHAEDGPDLGPLTAATEMVRDHLHPGQLVIVESTVAPGTTDGLVLDVLNGSGLRGGRDYNLAYSPERIDPGNTRYTLRNTPKLVGGLTNACRDRAAAFYALITDHVHLTRGMREAEAAKILENTYRQVNVALVNEFMRACHLLGVDGWDAIEAAATKPFGFASFRPGAGVGGNCIPVAPMLLAHRARAAGMPLEIVEAADRSNTNMPRWVAARICERLADAGVAQTAARVLLLGATYKPNVADGRNAPAAPLAAELRGRGIRVDFHDPHLEMLDVGGERLSRVPNLEMALEVADLAVVVQRHDYYSPDLLGRARRLLSATGSSD